MGQLLEALRRIESRGLMPRELPRQAASELPPRAIVADAEPLCEDPPIDMPAIDVAFDDLQSAAVELFDSVAQSKYRGVANDCGDKSIAVAQTESASTPHVAASGGTSPQANRLDALADYLVHVHGQQAAAALCFIAMRAVSNLPGLLGELAGVLAARRGDAPIVAEAQQTYVARLTAWRKEGRLALLAAELADDSAMALARHCDAVYLIAPLGAATAAELEAAARRVRSFATLCGVVATTHSPPSAWQKGISPIIQADNWT